ncbi:MAG: VCBS repeat-containing protein [Anaerolineae bacterium]|nr:VCBS repeat-containing protein [Anaerolineae bacterium]
MRQIHVLALVQMVLFVGLVNSTVAQEAAALIPTDLWEDATAATIGSSNDWTNKLELADINNDGWVDILFANGGEYDAPGTPVLNRVFLNQGAGELFTDVSDAVFGDTPMLTRVIKARDVSGDGNVDLLVGTTFQTQSYLYLGDGAGTFTDVTATHLPQLDASIGDLEFGDVDADGDLDVVLADWGAGSPMQNEGGRTMLWLNDGTGHFADVTDTQMPDVLVRFSWELEFVDVDNDYDLDILVSCKVCKGSFLFENDGTGSFTDVSEDRLPQFSNNYDFEAMDINGDAYLDLVTVNDAPGMREHLFLNNQVGGFEVAGSEYWSNRFNPTAGDNVVVFLDFDSDGDADFLIGSLDDEDRLLINDGTGKLSLARDVFVQQPSRGTRGTLYLAVADLDQDGKLDVAEDQGETAFDDRVYPGTNIAPDTAPPIITLVEQIATAVSGSPSQIRARVHDNKSPTMPHDWQSVSLRWTADGEAHDSPMVWYGEYLWRGMIEDAPAGDLSYQVCATDAAGNEACSDPQSLQPE